MPVASRVATWLICVSPLVWVPGGFDRFVFPKLVLAAAAIGFGALAVRRGELPKQVVLLVGAGLVWFSLSCLVSPTPVASLVGRWPRYEGLPVLLVYVGCAWLGARLLGDRTQRAVGDLLTALAITSLGLLALSVLSEIGWGLEGASVQERSGSVLGNATDQGLVAMMLLAVLFSAAAQRRTPLLVAGAAAAPVTIVLSGSRAALLAAGIAVGVQVVVQVVVRRRELLRPAVAVLAGLAVLALALPQLRDRLTSSGTVEGRLLLWDHGLKVGLDRWAVGAPSTFVDASGRYRDARWVREVGVADPPDSPHSWVLQAFDAGGVPLLLVALALAGLVLLLGWRRLREVHEARGVGIEQDTITLGTFGATVGYGVGLLPNFTIAGTTCLAAFLAGALVARVPEPTQGTQSAVRSRAVVALAFLGVVGLALGAGAERSLQRGIEAAGAGDLSAAEDAFDTARLLRPYDGDVAMFAAQAYAGAVSNGSPESAEAAADGAERWAGRSLARTPDTYASGLALAVARVSRNQLAEANDTLVRLTRIFPSEPDARIQLGIVKFGLRDVDGARAELERARDLDPDDPRAANILEQIDQRLD